jgi:hypothetical protein
MSPRSPPPSQATALPHPHSALLPLKPEPLLVLDIEPLELARQMTLIEAKLFNAIRRKEFLHGAWYGKVKEQKAPNLLKIITHGNRVTSWITTELLKFPTAEQRARVLTLFIQVLPVRSPPSFLSHPPLQHLEALRNFNGLIQVLSSLHSATVSKLKRSWSLSPLSLLTIEGN